jgi:hypothetical protein
MGFVRLGKGACIHLDPGAIVGLAKVLKEYIFLWGSRGLEIIYHLTPEITP